METGMPRFLTGRADIPERGRRTPGHLQLPESGIETSGGVAGDSQTELPGDPADHRHTSTESGVGEGYPVTPAARASRHYGERVHAGASGERTANGGDGLRTPQDEPDFRTRQLTRTRLELVPNSLNGTKWHQIKMSGLRKLLIRWWAQQDSNLRLPPCEGGVRLNGCTF